MNARRRLKQSDIAWEIDNGFTPGEIVDSAIGEGRATRHGEWTNAEDQVVDALSNLTAKGVLRLSDVYFSVPEPTRNAVARIAREMGYYWPPGERPGLRRAIEEQEPALHPVDIQVAVKFGPVERLLGDLYMLVREYELLLWGLIRAVLIAVHGPQRDEWWEKGVPLEERKALAAAAEEQGRYDSPWDLVTFGSMLKTVSNNRTAISDALRIGDVKDLLRDIREVGSIRNSVMHPSKGAAPTEPDFQAVIDASARLHKWTSSALEVGKIDSGQIPGPDRILTRPMIRRHIDRAMQ